MTNMRSVSDAHSDGPVYMCVGVSVCVEQREAKKYWPMFVERCAVYETKQCTLYPF